jgi:diguanylate cyclase (GGDEF)-like protein
MRGLMCRQPGVVFIRLGYSGKGVLDEVGMSRSTGFVWWLKHQPVGVRWYVLGVVTAAAGLSAAVLLLTPTYRSFSYGGVAVICALAVLASVATRRVMTAFPSDRTGQDMHGVWMMSSLLIWGPHEGLAVAVVVGGLWTQFVDSHWGGSHRQLGQQVLNVASIFVALDVAYLAMRVVGSQPFAIPQIVGVVVYLTVNSGIVFGVVTIAKVGGIRETLSTWSIRVMYLTEATLSIGFAAAWKHEPVAAGLLSGTLIAAGAGLHYAHLLEEASTDQRTGLLRPDTWTMTVSRLVSRQPVGVILADLDHFKQVNDELGHLAGDEVLAAIGATIAESLRPGDVAGRWGGEEFVVALPGLDLAEAREVADRLAEAVRTSPYVSAGMQIRCTLSAGVSYAAVTSPEEATAVVRQALREADVAMYAAKRAGRDRVVAIEDLTKTGDDLPSVNDLSNLAEGMLPTAQRDESTPRRTST